MKTSGISVIQESVQEAATGIAKIRSTIATLIMFCSGLCRTHGTRRLMIDHCKHIMNYTYHTLWDHLRYNHDK
jgi:hypothetical protein